MVNRPYKNLHAPCCTFTKETGVWLICRHEIYIVTDLQRGSFDRKEHQPVEVEQIGVPTYVKVRLPTRLGYPHHNSLDHIIPQRQFKRFHPQGVYH